MSLVIQKFNECVKKCEDKDKILQEHFLGLVKDCQKEYESKDNQALLDCLDKTASAKLPKQLTEKDLCLNNCKFDTVLAVKYDAKATKGASKNTRRYQRQIQGILDKEADFMLGLFSQLRKRYSEEKELNGEDKASKELNEAFKGNWEKWHKNATCIEIALNDISSGLGWEEIPTHNTNLEDTLMATGGGQKMGRDGVVRALWRTMKTRLELNYRDNLHVVPVISEPDFGEFGGGWSSEYDVYNPFDPTERLYVRETHELGTHADGTVNRSVEYYMVEDISEMKGYLGHIGHSGYSGGGILSDRSETGYPEDYAWDDAMESLRVDRWDTLEGIEAIERVSGGETYGSGSDDFWFYDEDKYSYDKIIGKIYSKIIEDDFLSNYHSSLIPFVKKEKADGEDLSELLDWISKQKSEDLERETDKIEAMTDEEKDRYIAKQELIASGRMTTLNGFLKEIKQ